MNIFKLFYLLKRKEIPENINKIMFFKLGALGDVLMTTPLVRAVRKKFPKAQIYYYCGKSYCNILKGNKYIDKVIPFDQDLFFKKRLFGLLNLRKKINKFDLAFVLDKHWSVSTFLSFCDIKYRIGFDRDGEGFANNFNVKYYEIKHEIDYYLDLLKSFNGLSQDKSMDLIIDKKAVEFSERFYKKNKIDPKKTICIIPGGANNPGVNDDPIRRWPIENYVLLIDELIKKYNVVLLGGIHDKKIHIKIQNKVKEKVFDLAGKTNIFESAAIMKKSKAVICNDSGPMHIASSTGVKVISLFGPTHPKRKAPLNQGSVYIWKDNEIYDNNFDLFGKKNKDKAYMKKIKIKDILQQIKPS